MWLGQDQGSLFLVFYCCYEGIKIAVRVYCTMWATWETESRTDLYVKFYLVWKGLCDQELWCFRSERRGGVFYIYILLSLFFPLIWLIRRYINVSFVRKKCDVGRRRVPERNCADTDIIQPLCWGYHTTRSTILLCALISHKRCAEGYYTALCTDIMQTPGRLYRVSCIMYIKGIYMWIGILLYTASFGYHTTLDIIKVYWYDTITVLRI